MLSISSQLDRFSSGNALSANPCNKPHTKCDQQHRSADRSRPLPPQNITLSEVFSLAKDSEDVESFLSQMHQSETQLDVILQHLDSQSDLRSRSSTDVPIRVKQLDNNTHASSGAMLDDVPKYPVLTKELAFSRAHRNMIFVTCTNLHFVDFVQNWIAHFEDIGTVLRLQLELLGQALQHHQVLNRKKQNCQF